MRLFTTQKFLSFCLALLLSGMAWGQQINLPLKSPKASASFTIGYTEITIAYSSPAVRGRTIWGVLEPYGEIWRAGANEATKISFSTDVIVEGKLLSAGQYSFFLIPKETGSWTAIFNEVAEQWGSYEYDQSKDALRVDAMVKDSDINEEHLNYQIVEQGPDAGYIRLGWENKRIYVRFKVDVLDEAMANIQEAIGQSGRGS